MSDARSSSRTLAVVRCGDASLHRHWAADAKTVDLAISYFGNDDNRAFEGAHYIHRMKAGKWDGIADFFRANPDTLLRYDHFWFPDDDLSLSGAKVDAMMAIGIAHGLDLWQPALDRDSYYGHAITLAIPGAMLRYTNFVEIMTPVMSRRLLHDTLPLFGGTRSGFGLDYYWAQRVCEMRGGATDGCAIIDAVTITHTRPLGQVLRKLVDNDGGLSTREEYRQILDRVKRRNPVFRSMGLAVPRKRHHAARRTTGQSMTAWRLVGGVVRAFHGAGTKRKQPIHPWLTLRYVLTAFF